MKRTTLQLFLAVATAVFTLGQTTGSEVAPTKPDTWERTKECAAQAEKIMRPMAAEALRQDELLDWSNHYSPKFERCFVRIVHRLKIIGPNAKHNGVVYTGEIRLIGTELRDAFERAPMALVSPPITKQPCVLEGQGADCAKVEDFIADRMKN